MHDASSCSGWCDRVPARCRAGGRGMAHASTRGKGSRGADSRAHLARQQRAQLRPKRLHQRLAAQLLVHLVPVQRHVGHGQLVQAAQLPGQLRRGEAEARRHRAAGWGRGRHDARSDDAHVVQNARACSASAMHRNSMTTAIHPCCCDAHCMSLTKSNASASLASERSRSGVPLRSRLKNTTGTCTQERPSRSDSDSRSMLNASTCVCAHRVSCALGLTGMGAMLVQQSARPTPAATHPPPRRRCCRHRQRCRRRRRCRRQRCRCRCRAAPALGAACSASARADSNRHSNKRRCMRCVGSYAAGRLARAWHVALCAASTAACWLRGVKASKQAQCSRRNAVQGAPPRQRTCRRRT